MFSALNLLEKDDHGLGRLRGTSTMREIRLRFQRQFIHNTNYLSICVCVQSGAGSSWSSCSSSPLAHCGEQLETGDNNHMQENLSKLVALMVKVTPWNLCNYICSLIHIPWCFPSMKPLVLRLIYKFNIKLIVCAQSLLSNFRNAPVYLRLVSSGTSTSCVMCVCWYNLVCHWLHSLHLSLK